MELRKIFTILFLLSFYISWGQREVSGVVTDTGGMPIPGVSVLVKGTSQGVETGFDGDYKIKVTDGAILVFSYVGMESQEKKILKGTSKYNVTLGEAVQEIGEVVVTGITKTDRRMFIGATEQLKMEDVKLDGVPDVSRSLEGRSAGVVVQNVSGTFGSAPKIQVRGATSILGASKPLWVVDGVIMEDVVEVDATSLASGDANTLISSAIAGLNSDDIESFQILKDGSATSIYGARAMAGVIVITTKRGRSGSSQFSYSNESAYRLIPSYRDFNIMNSQEQLVFNQEMEKAGWLNYADVASARTSGVYGKMYNLFDGVDQNGNFFVANTPEGRLKYLRSIEKRNTNWFNALFNSGIMQTHSVSMSGGTDKGNYYASVSAMLDPGWTKQSEVNRYTANFNASHTLFQGVRLNVLGNASYRKQRAPGTLRQTTDIVSGTVTRDFDINPYSYAINTARTMSPHEYYVRNYAPFNILNELENNYLDFNVADFKAQAELSWKIFPKIEWTTLGAIKYQHAGREHKITESSNQALAYRAMQNATVVKDNDKLYKNPDFIYGLPYSILPQGGIYYKNSNSLNSYDFRTTLSYRDEFKDTHFVEAFGGTEINATDRHEDKFTGWGMQYDMGEIPFFIYDAFKKFKEDNTKYYEIENTRSRIVAFFANANYSWKRKYIANGTIRYEGTNRLGRSRSARWLPTWNGSLAWDVANEDFFTALKPFSALKLRGSYSLTATSGPSYVSNSRVHIKAKSPWRPIASTQEPALEISDLENSELTYEKKHELNLGFDFGLFNNVIQGSFDWYRRNNFDLIGLTDVQGIGGFVTKYGNVADMKASGVELSLSSTNVKTKDFSWTTNFVYSRATNEVTTLKKASRAINLINGRGYSKEGYPVGSVFSIPFKGLNKEGLPTYLNDKNEVTIYDINFQSFNDLDYLQYSGTVNPTDTGSLGNTFKYKGVSLNVFLTYAFGSIVRLDDVFSYYYSDSDALPREMTNRWVMVGDEKYTTIPAIATKEQENRIGRENIRKAYNAYNYTSERIASGDFVRLKEISIGYDFDKDFVEKLKLTKLSVKLQATNLLLLYSDKKLRGQDPEFFNTGGVATPTPKQITFSLKLGL